MSNYFAIATVSAALRQLIYEAAQATVGNVNVVVGRPAPQNPGASVFLYQVRPNPAFRNDDLPTRNAGGGTQRRPQLALELHYLLSFYGDDANYLPQRLMAAVMARLHARPLLSPSALNTLLADPALASLAGSNLAEQPELVRLSPASLSLEDISKLWSTLLQTPYVLSTAYVASVVLLEAEVDVPPPGPPVLDRTVVVVPTVRPKIARIEAAAGPDTLITSGSRVVLIGPGLAGELTQVRIAGQNATVVSARGDRVICELPPNLDIGPHPALVIHQLALGRPPLPHRAIESPVVPLVVHPQIATLAGGAPDVTVAPIAGGYRVTVRLIPTVRTEQSAQLELLDGDIILERRESAPRANRADPLVFEINRPAGVYGARVRVDWAESAPWAVTLP